MKFVDILIQPGERTVYSREVAEILCGQTTAFFDEKGVEHEALIVRSSFLRDEGGAISITLQIPDEACTENMSPTLFLPHRAHLN